MDTFQADLLVTPDSGNWYAENISEDAFTDSFASGEGISVALRNTESFYLPGTEIELLCVVRDAYGNVLPDFVSAEKMYWKNLWLGGNSRNGEIDLTKVPTDAGNYVLHLYIDGMALAELPFTIR